MRRETDTALRIDISQVRQWPVPEGEFPAMCPAADYRVWIAPEAHRGVAEHALTDTSVELCGVLVGSLRKDQYGPFGIIDGIIRGRFARNSATQVTFTHDTWEHIYRTLDGEYGDRQILGWYHTHPGLGVFLSGIDLFIHENFFDLPHQVALVIDPLSGHEGLFHWRRGRVEPVPIFWVGESVYAREDTESTYVASGLPSRAGPGEAPVQPQFPAKEQNGSGIWRVVSVGLLPFRLIGYLVAHLIEHLALVVSWASLLVGKEEKDG